LIPSMIIRSSMLVSPSNKGIAKAMALAKRTASRGLFKWGTKAESYFPKNRCTYSVVNSTPNWDKVVFTRSSEYFRNAKGSALGRVNGT
jgi:hypothetical protein